jgi:hypothetical protein
MILLNCSNTEKQISRTKNIDLLFCWMKEHVDSAAWFYSEPSKAEKNVQDDNRNMCWTELDGGAYLVFRGREGGTQRILRASVSNQATP